MDIRTQPLTNGGNRFRYVLVNGKCHGLITVPRNLEPWTLTLIEHDREGRLYSQPYTYETLMDLAEALRDKFQPPL